MEPSAGQEPAPSTSNVILDLPNVTLVLIDCVAHALSAFALRHTLRLIRPKALILVTDRPQLIPLPDHLCEATLLVRKLDSLSKVAYTLWYEVPLYARTSHLLIMQYDGFVVWPGAWNDKFLQYDYIGAVWPWHETLTVGNGGFSLRSRRLMKHLSANRSSYPIGDPEDDRLCRIYRPHLEREGFIWAPDLEAIRFSFERPWSNPRPASFGFHGIFNLRSILSDHDFATWVSLAPDYVRSKVEWKELGL